MTRMLPKILLFIAYLLSVAFLVSHLCDNTDLALKYVILHPISTAQYLYHYVKWWGLNKDVLSFREIAWFVFAVAAPILFFITMKSVFYATSTFLKAWIKSLTGRIFNKQSPKPQNAQQSKANLDQMKKRMMQAAEKRIDQHLHHLKQDKKKK